MTIRKRKPTRLAGIVLACGVLLAPPLAQGETEVQPYGERYDTRVDADDSVEPVVVEVLTGAQLEELVGPVALYPDDLLAVVLPASTYPLQIVQAARLLDALETNPDLKPDPTWDESVVALLNYPDVIALMNEDLNWTYTLGDAVVTQQSDVIAAIERFRDRAWEAGNLRSDEHVEVVREEEVIRITPVEREIVYVPYYEPERVVIYQRAPVVFYHPRPYPLYYYPYADHYAFGSGFFFGITTAYQIGWGSGYLHLHRHSYASHPFYGRRYLPRHYYHERYHRPLRRAVSRGGYAAPRGGRDVGRAYRGDRWQAGPGHGARPRAALRGARQSRPVVTANAFRSRNPDVVRTSPRDTRREQGARRGGDRRTNAARATGNGRDAALRSRPDRTTAEPTERAAPRERRSGADRNRRDTASTVALADRGARRSASSETGIVFRERGERRGADVRRAPRDNSAALTTTRLRQRSASQTTTEARRTPARTAGRNEQRAERRVERQAERRVERQVERRAAPAAAGERTAPRERRAAPAGRSEPAARETRSERSSARAAERKSRRSETRAKQRGSNRAGNDAARGGQSRQRDRR